MRFLVNVARRYLDEMDIWDIALIKVCLLSLGVLFGIGVASKDKKHVGIFAVLVFIGTYIPLMSKVIEVAKEEKEEEDGYFEGEDFEDYEDCFEAMD